MSRKTSQGSRSSRTPTGKSPVRSRPAPAPPDFTTGEEFESLTDEQKEAVFRPLDQEIPLSETRPLNAEERTWWKEMRERMKEDDHGRRRAGPEGGRGSQAISVTVEKALLDEADAIAKQAGIGRSGLIGRALRIAIDLTRLGALERTPPDTQKFVAKARRVKMKTMS